MNAIEVCRQDVDGWTDVEVVYWFNQFSKDEQAAQMRNHMLEQIEIRDATEPRVIKIDSTVVD